MTTLVKIDQWCNLGRENEKVIFNKDGMELHYFKPELLEDGEFIERLNRMQIEVLDLISEFNAKHTAIGMDIDSP